jgi:hypothetical protein
MQWWDVSSQKQDKNKICVAILFFEAFFGILCALLPKDGKGAAENRDH